MNLEDLQRQWLEHDQKLDSGIRLNRELLNANTLIKARASLRRQSVFAIVGTTVNCLAIPLCAVFIAVSHSSLRFVLAALLVGVYFIANMVGHIRQARALSKINYSEPITVIQRKIEAVVKMRILFSRWLAMSMVLSWVPISIVLFKVLLGWDLYTLVPRWLIANTIVGLACIPLVLWVSKKQSAAGEDPRVQRFVRDIAGNNLNAAQAFLATLAEFEDEAIRSKGQGAAVR